MDIVRPDVKRKKRIRRIIYIVAILILLPLVTYGLSRLKPAPPSVDGSVIYADTVKRGDMLLQVRGLGTLVPEVITMIPAKTEGQVVQRLILPGALVKPDSVIMILTNPTLQQQLQSAQFQLKSAQAALVQLKATVGNSLMALRSTAASVRSNYLTAQMQAQADETGYQQNVVAKVIADKSRVAAEELKVEDELAQKQVDSFAASVDSQLAVQQNTVNQDQAQVDLYKREVDELTVRAGLNGVLQDEPAQVGQDMASGAELASVAEQTKLKAQLQIPETQVGDVQLNQSASVDTHNGIIPGHVTRIDPSVTNGTRTVDVHLDGPLPPGAVPNLSVEGTILIEKLTNVLHVGRPVHGDQDSKIGLFKEVDDGKEAVQVQVDIGKVSVSTVEIIKGLNIGDVVILSDMSQYDNFDRIRIK
ncbi:MAG: HlyD family efflux transporter periplasmic adaptor subunit [Candidatus Acidiferrales bacterium]